MAVDYTVTSIQERLIPMVGGGFGRILQVTYTTTKGFVGTLDVSKTDATPEKLKALIQADVARIHALYNI